MDLRVLSNTFTPIDVLDNHQIDSVIWVEKYNKEGEFEIYAQFTYQLLQVLQQGYYIVSASSDRSMVIEGIEIRTNPETGNKLVVRGRTLESLLDRRIVLKQIQIDSSFQAGIQSILNADVINSIYPERNFPNFVFSTSADAAVTTPTLKGQFYSQNLLDVIKDLTASVELGFKLVLNASNQMVFSLYAGKNRSYDQSTYPFVIFSPEFDNLIRSEYYTTNRLKKNYVLISGDPQSSPPGYPGFPIRNQAWTSDIGTGLSRREMFADASDLSIYIEGTSTRITEPVYLLQLYQRGLEVLAANTDIVGFDGQVDLSRTYTYGVDFNLGDIVQLIDSFGHTAKVRVSEMTISDSVSTGYTMYPTLELI